MSGDSKATSDRMSSVCMGSDNDLSNPRLESKSKGSSVSNRESASDPPSEEASPFG